MTAAANPNRATGLRPGAEPPAPLPGQAGDRPSPGPEPALADRLRGVRVGARQDLEVTRHVFRGEPTYVIRDPMTFQSHRLDPGDYAVFIAIAPDRPLGEIFSDLVGRGLTAREDEESFYRFVLTLHRMNFLNLPISDEKLLYQRYQARRRARRKEKLLGFLFLRVPLVNPDGFLTRTIKYARPVFGRWFFAAWVVWVAAAGFVAVRNYAELVEPIQGVLAARNLPIMWLTLIGLKVLHEFGHAYACKHYGGYVPEMGAYFIVFTPCAYVDATACWGFTSKRQRLIVCLAGMYVESIAAALAVFVWAAAPPGLLHDVAYNAIFLAGVVTVLFNINPLLRYDGYYVLSDLVEIPNLRQRSTRYVIDILKRVFLGIRTGAVPTGLPRSAGIQPAPGGRRNARTAMLLLSFGVAASLYRVVLVLAIGAIVASKMFLLGVGLAVVFVGNTVITLVRQVTHYLWYAQETAPVRARAVAVSLVLLVGIPAVIVVVPIGSSVEAAGVLGSSEEAVVRAGVDGFVRAARAKLGQAVEPGDVLVELSNDALGEAIATARTRIRASDIRRRAFEVEDAALALEEQEQGHVYRLELERHRRRQARLLVRSESAGRVIDCLREKDVGRFVPEGEPVATIVAGRWQIRTILTGEQMADVRSAPGGRVEVRVPAVPLRIFSGVIRRIAPAGSRNIDVESLTHIGGGDIAVNPDTHEARQPYFEIVIDVLDPDAGALRHGMTCHVRFPATAHSIGTRLVRRLIRFTDALLQG